MEEDKNKESEEIRRGDFAKEKGEVILREHEFDGIQEFDQKLPNWWLITLYVAIAWAAIHWFVYYHTGSMKTDAERMEEWQANLEEAKKEELEKVTNELDDATLINVWSTDTDIVAKGQAKYNTFCLACHGPDLTATMAGNPLPGLSLVDGEWKFGGKPLDIFKIINEGSPPESDGHNGAKMMPWGQSIPPNEIAEITAFIISKNRNEYPLDE